MYIRLVVLVSTSFRVIGLFTLYLKVGLPLPQYDGEGVCFFSLFIHHLGSGVCNKKTQKDCWRNLGLKKPVTGKTYIPLYACKCTRTHTFYDGKCSMSK